MGALPPLHELARSVGLELPDFLGRVAAAAKDRPPHPPSGDAGAKK